MWKQLAFKATAKRPREPALMMKKNTYICERMFPVVSKPEAKQQSILLLFQLVTGVTHQVSSAQIYSKCPIDLIDAVQGFLPRRNCCSLSEF